MHVCIAITKKPKKKKNRSKFRYHTAVLYYLILFTLLLFFLPYVFGQLFPVIYPVVL